ncbi:MAG TPA: DNA repair protein RecO [Steroidobacteraceae bacterium]|jgi:DNA repair protein RecO (recombination protein O)|nr:DNA repair protein RecO [Steroidobacteraceae bacterium]
MTRSPHRVQLTTGYLLHHYPWRDSSRILEVFTREHGRLSLFARGVRGPSARLAPVLQPFQLLLLSWSGRGEAPQLTGAERAHHCGALPRGCLLACFYLNELLMRLTTRHDPLPQLFDNYQATLDALRASAPLAPALRVFEKRLLEVLGYGLNLATEAHSGARLASEGWYRFRPALGFVAAANGSAGAIAGASLVNLAQETLRDARELEDARRVLQAALGVCLEGRPLSSRAVAKSVLRKAAR